MPEQNIQEARGKKQWSASSQHGALIARKGGSMKTRMASYTLDTLPALTEARKAQLKALAARPESEIDYSDIPVLTEDRLLHARRGVFYRPVKRQIDP